MPFMKFLFPIFGIVGGLFAVAVFPLLGVVHGPVCGE